MPIPRWNWLLNTSSRMCLLSASFSLPVCFCAVLDFAFPDRLNPRIRRLTFCAVVLAEILVRPIVFVLPVGRIVLVSIAHWVINVKPSCTSGAKDDTIDSELLEDLLRSHPERLRIYQPTPELERKLELFCQQRRKNCRTGSQIRKPALFYSQRILSGSDPSLCTGCSAHQPGARFGRH